MAHSKIQRCNYDELSGISTVVRSSKYGEFCGVAICHPDDEDIKNRFDGCKIADYQALIEIQKERAKDFWHRYYGVVEMVNALPYEDYYLDRQCKLFLRRAKHESNKVKTMKENLKRMSDELPRQRREFREKHENKEN